MTYKNIVNASKHTKQLSLYNIIGGKFYHDVNGWSKLNIKEDLHLNNLRDLIGGRGHNYLRLIMNYIQYGRNYGIFERLVFNGKKWEYIAGQDYVAEMNILRKILRDGN